MTTYVWLRSGAEERLAALNDQQVYVGPQIKIDHTSGTKYVVVHEDIFANPTSVPNELVEKVTVRDVTYRGFRTEGIYRRGKAVLIVKSTHTSEAGRSRWYQEISVSAPTMRAAKKIYSLVRQGELLPEENWEADSLSLPLTEATV